MKKISKTVLFCLILGIMVQQGFSKGLEKHVLIPVSIKKNIKAVYQIKDDDWKKGLGKGLLYIKKLVEAYDSMGIDPTDRSIHAVLHGSAGYWLLKDKPYNKIKGINTGNPNIKIIKDLVKNGVSIELCAQTMNNNGWEFEDILPEVKIVVGAYPRIIDLQMQGYAYIRF